MATNANWTIIIEDKKIIKNTGDGAGNSYTIVDDAFWNQAQFANIWAIQHGTSSTSDEVEYKDGSPHSAYDEAVLGPIQDFITKWDTAHLAQLQSNWDNDNVIDPQETAEQKINRLGAKPTSYSS